MPVPAQVWLLAGLLVAAKLADPPEESPSQARERRRREREGQNPAKPLYHVTGTARAALIRKQGFVPGILPSEAGAEEYAQAELAGEDLDWYESEMSEEARAREAFDVYMREAYRDARQRDPHVPDHTDAVFFWDDKGMALSAKRAMQQNTAHPFTVLEVDASKIPCRCYQASNTLADDLFSTIEGDLETAEACAGITGFYDEEEEEEANCERFDQMARDYYRTVKPWDGRSNPENEIMCPCEIPPEAIVREM